MFGFGVWETIFIIIPISILIVLPYWKIFSKAGFSSWWSLSLLLPIINILVIYILAFSRWPIYNKISEMDNINIDIKTESGKNSNANLNEEDNPQHGVTKKSMGVKVIFFVILLCFALFFLLFKFNHEDSVLTKILDNFNVGLYQVECSSGGCVIINTSNGIVKILGSDDDYRAHKYARKAEF